MNRFKAFKVELKSIRPIQFVKRSPKRSTIVMTRSRSLIFFSKDDRDRDLNFQKDRDRDRDFCDRANNALRGPY